MTDASAAQPSKPEVNVARGNWYVIEAVRWDAIRALLGQLPADQVNDILFLRLKNGMRAEMNRVDVVDFMAGVARAQAQAGEDAAPKNPAEKPNDPPAA